MRRVLAACAALVAVSAVAGCNASESPVIPGPGPSKVKVDTPDLRALKAKIGMQDCVPGPGGGALPDLTLACLGGGTSVNLSTLKGPLVLSLWQAGCTPCRKEMPALAAYAARTPGVKVVGIDFEDAQPPAALELAKNSDVGYPLLADPQGALDKTSPLPHISGLPMTVFIAADGSIAHIEPGSMTSEQEVAAAAEKYLGVAG